MQTFRLFDLTKSACFFDCGEKGWRQKLCLQCANIITPNNHVVQYVNVCQFVNVNVEELLESKTARKELHYYSHHLSWPMSMWEPSHFLYLS